MLTPIHIDTIAFTRKTYHTALNSTHKIYVSTPIIINIQSYVFHPCYDMIIT